MKTRALVAAMAVGLTTWLVGCGGGEQLAETEAAEVMPSNEEAVSEAVSSSSPVEREFWLALAEEPGFHLNLAREDFLGGHNRAAAQEVEKVAAVLSFESRHSHSQNERELLFASVQELREVARTLGVADGPGGPGPSIEALDHVAALAFRAIATHQVTLGRDALEAGDARAAGLYIQETANAVQIGLDRSGIHPSPSLDERLEAARQVGQRLAQDGEGSRQGGLDALATLDDAVEALTHVLTSGRM